MALNVDPIPASIHNAPKIPRIGIWFYRTRAVAVFTGSSCLSPVLSAIFSSTVSTDVVNDQLADSREQLRASVTFQTINEVVYTDKEGKITAYVFIPQFYNSRGDSAQPILSGGLP